MTDDPPGPDVLHAFGVGGCAPVLLAGGRGLTWHVGDLVLRPHDGPSVTDWRAGVLAALEPSSAFRTPRPVTTTDGAWRSGAWEAWEYVAGRADESRVLDVIRTGRAFHQAIAELDRPAFLDHAADPWSRADRMAWGEDPLPADPTLDRLAGVFQPVHEPSQLVHGDLLGNVLFAEGQPPAVIDWPPYWRPAGFGAAVAVADAACWHGFPLDRVQVVGPDQPAWAQLLVRALTFRIATAVLLGAWDGTAIARHQPVVNAVVSAASCGTVQA
ncbi:hypothetical protein [Curtobacterium sp. VKM Ac-1393]|uniref:hypothetical protein n=1 Tax=Curtobacterium sp. VKM Ac-1393 TaxID=2783814 RepID=UPI00188C4C52|nr:hypothetical protein [Curtobacterium sp. VKM Ac-1393]MBF4609358.1 hypothetical protein [Curtobacterium sp. VKM Ac-1393]